MRNILKVFCIFLFLMGVFSCSKEIERIPVICNALVTEKHYEPFSSSVGIANGKPVVVSKPSQIEIAISFYYKDKEYGCWINISKSLYAKLNIGDCIPVSFNYVIYKQNDNYYSKIKDIKIITNDN